MTLIHLTIAWLVGIAAAHQLWQAGLLGCDQPSAPLWGGALGGVLTAALFTRRLPRARAAGVLLLFTLLGAWRYQLRPLEPCFGPADLAYYNDRQAGVAQPPVIEGVIADDPDVRDRYTLLRVRAERLFLAGIPRPVRGLALVRAPRFATYAYGDRVRVTGFLRTPPRFEGFDYRAYLARQGVYSIVQRPRVERLAGQGGSPLRRTLYRLRRALHRTVGRLLPEPTAALLSGILLGIESGIPRALYEAFNATATSHIIVISGFNITIIAGLLSAGLSRLLGARRAAPLVLAGIALYVLLVGADAAVTRAGIMGGLSVVALQLGRRTTAIISLAASALLMTALNPLTLWDVGFQLSAMATLGLIVFAPPLQARAEALLRRGDGLGLDRIGPFLNDGLILTAAAQITTTPLVVYYFGRLSLVSLITNLLILPVQPYIMTWGGLAVLLATVPGLFPLAQLMAYIPWLCLTYTIWIVEATARLPLAFLDVGRFHPLWLWLYYLGIGAVMLARGHRERWRLWLAEATRHLPDKTLALLLAAATLLVWTGAAQGPDGLLHVFFLDVGQGDAILIRSPAGRQVLIDGGPSGVQLMWQLGRRIPFWDRRLDLVVLTHPDRDHMNGLIPLLARYRVDLVLDSPLSASAPEAQPWLTQLNQQGIRREIAQRGQRIHLGDGVWLDVLHPGTTPLTGTGADDNNNSIVIRLGYGRICFLLTGDIERAAEFALLRSGAGVRCPVLKVSHHGSGGTTSAAFVRAVAPQLAVIQVGAGNRYGHPDPEVLRRLSPALIYRTDQRGTIEVTSDGARLWVRTARGGR